MKRWRKEVLDVGKLQETERQIKQIHEGEQQAMNNLTEANKTALKIIEENHFHIRLWQAVGGEKPKRGRV